MKNKYIILLFAFLLIIPINAQQIKKVPDKINLFFTEMIDSSYTTSQIDLSKFVDEESLKLSNRLDIHYEGVKNKFLLSYEIDPPIISEIKNNNLTYDLNAEKLKEDFLKITFNVSTKNYSKTYYFKNDKMVSPVLYFTKDWRVFISKYFRVKVSNPALFNEYSLRKLDDFVDTMIKLLQINNDRQELLQKEKINYILCKDEDEIKKISGFDTRGIYVLAYDEVITTFNTHYHELSHLLMNYKLQNLPLYTLPFFQEGFAVAVGGRGGIGRDILLNIGYFLEKSSFLKFNSILTNKDFMSENASMTYPSAGLYNYFLISSYGINSYIKLYLKYSGSAKKVNELDSAKILLPPIEEYEKFLNDFKDKTTIKIHKPGNDNYYHFKVRTNLLLSTKDKIKNYVSKKFVELFPNIDYQGQKYLITADKNEISVYNLYTNSLIASYTMGFTINAEPVPIEDSYFSFYVKKDVFDENKDEMISSEF